MDLKETNVLGDDIGKHWYYRSKAEAVIQLLGHEAPLRNILDIGAGSGFFSKYLLSRTTAIEAWCVDIGYGHNSDSTQAGNPIHFRRSVDSVSVDLVLLMDVLEHVDDDVGLLTEYVQKVPPGSRFLISVPAFQILWSKHDVFLEHKRRYTLRQLKEVVEHAGLTVEQGNYYFGAVFPIAAMTRIIGKVFSRYLMKSGGGTQLKRHHPIVNEFLAMLSRGELHVFKYNRWIGLTAFCLATNKACSG
jgi:SAM-dependent methyltransferase